MRGAILMALLTASLTLTAQSPCGSPAQFHSGANGLSGQDGIFFNLVASADLTINCFETYFTSNNTNRTNIYIWYRNGSHIGHETDPAQWTLIDSILSFTIPTNQANLHHIPISVNVPILTGDTAAFYITNGDLPGMTNTGIRYDPGNGSPGGVQSSNAHLTVQRGAGSYDRWIIYAGSRLFAGRVNYTLSTSTGLSMSEGLTVGGPYPNPANEALWVDLSSFTGTIDLQVFDTAGRLSRTERVQGGGRVRLDVSMLAPGAYTLHTVGGQATSAHRFVKE